MSWIKIAAASLALVASASIAGAQGTPGAGPGQGQGGPGMRGQGMRGQAMLFEGITLTASQKLAVDSIQAKYRAERGKTMSAGQGRQAPGARTKMTELMDKQNAEIRALLTADQQVAFDKNITEMKERRLRMRSTVPRA